MKKYSKFLSEMTVQLKDFTWRHKRLRTCNFNKKAKYSPWFNWAPRHEGVLGTGGI